MMAAKVTLLESPNLGFEIMFQMMNEALVWECGNECSSHCYGSISSFARYAKERTQAGKICMKRSSANLSPRFSLLIADVKGCYFSKKASTEGSMAPLTLLATIAWRIDSDHEQDMRSKARQETFIFWRPIRKKLPLAKMGFKYLGAVQVLGGAGYHPDFR